MRELYGQNAIHAGKKNGGDLIPGSDEMTTFERHEAEMEYLRAAQKKRDKINRESASS